MTVYRVMCETAPSPAAMLRGTAAAGHAPVLVVRACDAADARHKVCNYGIGWQPLTGEYSLTGGLGHGAVVMGDLSVRSVRACRARPQWRTERVFSICADCMLMLANGECDPERPESEPDPLSDFPPSWHVVLGVEEHRVGCDEEVRQEDGCECDQLGFSWGACHGCGSRLGGDRFGAVQLREYYGGLPLQYV